MNNTNKRVKNFVRYRIFSQTQNAGEKYYHSWSLIFIACLLLCIKFHIWLLFKHS